MEKPSISKILQVCIVVDELHGYMERWNDEFGIGPWTMLELNDSTLDRQRIEGEPAKWGIRMALCDALNVQLELIEPLYGETTYMTFLKKHGPGLHHLAIEPKGGFEAWTRGLAARGADHFILGGNERGERGERQFEYVDLTRELGAIFETYNDTNGFIPGSQTAAGVYPPKGDD